MSRFYVAQVETCRSCPLVTNSVREHDDPFTSSPAENTWFCTKPRNRYDKIVEPDAEPPDWCPLPTTPQPRTP